MSEVKHPYRRLRWAGRVEGVTLVLLVGIAVPLKRIGGISDGVALMGPIHGAVFIVYLLALAEAVADGRWTAREIARTALVAIVPFGPFFNDRFIARKEADLRTETQ
jgi:integral membrane protein